MPKGVPVDLVGQRFGAWTVLRKLDDYPEGTVKWHCICDCGNTADVATNNLRSGRSTRCRSCGNTRDNSSRWAAFR
jgi:hypothetical protein